MAVLAPWLLDNNPLDLMRSGAGLGLQVRSQAAQEENALARQALAQQQLDQQRELAVTRAAEALRQHNALEAYRRSQYELGAARADQATQAQAAVQKLRERHQDFLERQATIRNTPKEYGSITKEEVAPGVLAVFRPGSPGLHIVNEKTGTKDLTSKQKLDLQLRGFNLMKQQADLEPGSPAAVASTNILSAISQALAPTSNADRIRVRDKKTGRLGWWEGGQPPTEYEIIKE